MKLTAVIVSFLLSFNGVVEAAPTLKEQKQINCIATAVYFEARGSSTEGQAAVGQVIRNRVNSVGFPQTYCGVVYQKGQFSWTKHKNLKIKDQKSWEEAKKIAVVTYYLGWPDSLIGNSTYFHSGKKPYWTKSVSKVTKIDGHKFYQIKS